MGRNMPNSQFLSASLIKDEIKAISVVVAAAVLKWMCSQLRRVYGDVSVFVYNLTCLCALDKDNSFVYKLLLLPIFLLNSHLSVTHNKTTTFLINSISFEN